MFCKTAVKSQGCTLNDNGIKLDPDVHALVDVCTN